MISSFDPSAWSAALETLSHRGLDLIGVVRPSDVWTTELPESAAPWPRLLIIGNTGRSLWHRMRAEGGLATSHPIDTYCRTALTRFTDQGLSDIAWASLWPDGPFPVIDVARHLGWHHPSPIGIGIHPTFGPWTAYRHVLGVKAPLPLTPPISSSAPCDACPMPCAEACPTGAVQVGKPMDLAACFDARLNAAGPCAERCDARRRCPVGTAYAYPPEQERYHHLVANRMASKA